ncbi:hypothetical protein EML15_08055 [Corynebacterium sp. sy017]|uniref:hypothetical protein n=1 Tax=unclassified Corynebacterium TaxID=2624378 RepID=UPI0011851DCA|nr:MULTISPECIES: hypothetical protein [unclassified Corynebacterium]MBP3089096.1 hypothetical protein [Corynebacterium sp. sy017]TSD91410.1 hypothetical protein ELY17_08065 [Corynebacterium sp. SY003]
MITVETLSTVFDQYYAQKHRHNDPGGWLPIFFRCGVIAAVYYALTYAIVGFVSSAILMTSVAVGVELVSVLLLKSWRPGMTSDEVRQAWKQTVEMTKRMTLEETNE